MNISLFKTDTAREVYELMPTLAKEEEVLVTLWTCKASLEVVVKVKPKFCVVFS